MSAWLDGSCFRSRVGEGPCPSCAPERTPCRQKGTDADPLARARVFSCRRRTTASAASTPEDDSPMSEAPHRYTAAKADEIEKRWPRPWDEEGTFHAATPGGSRPAAAAATDLPA